MRAIRCLDPESAHRLAIRLLKSGLVPESSHTGIGAGNVHRVWGKLFPSPLGIAAGFDKDGEVMGPLLRLGAGFVEIGAVTPLPQPGNPRPRVFRLIEDEAVINRYGFNSQGHDAVSRRLATFRTYSRHADGIVGVNLGINKEENDPVEAYRRGVIAFYDIADFLTINVSSPNTPGLRDLQQEELLAHIAEASHKTIRELGSTVPLLVKLSPDLADDAADRIVRQLTDAAIVDGWIVSNTPVTRPNGLRSRYAKEQGGLSGTPLRQRSTELIRLVYQASSGAPIIGAGGVDSADAALEKVKAGAALVQIYSALVFAGPGLLNQIDQELMQLLANQGFSRLADAIGADHRH